MSEDPICSIEAALVHAAWEDSTVNQDIAERMGRLKHPQAKCWQCGEFELKVPRSETVGHREGAFGGGKGRMKFGSILIDPPWQFSNRTGKVAPEHKRLHRYPTMSLEEIRSIPVKSHAAEQAHIYLWVPNALLGYGLDAMKSWGFTYKTNIVWYKVRKDNGPDGRGVGFYFRNVTELVLFGVCGKIRTLAPGRRTVNLISSRKREHSRKPDELYDLIEKCSPGPYLELFARYERRGWTQYGDEFDKRSAA